MHQLHLDIVISLLPRLQTSVTCTAGSVLRSRIRQLFRIFCWRHRRLVQVSCDRLPPTGRRWHCVSCRLLDELSSTFSTSASQFLPFYNSIGTTYTSATSDLQVTRAPAQSRPLPQPSLVAADCKPASSTRQSCHETFCLISLDDARSLDQDHNFLCLHMPLCLIISLLHTGRFYQRRLYPRSILCRPGTNRLWLLYLDLSSTRYSCQHTQTHNFERTGPADGLMSQEVRLVASDVL